MLAQVIAILTSIITLASMWMAGNERAFGWIIGMLNQVIWFVFILVFGAWGLLPLNIALVFVYGRNYYKWKTEDDYITFVEHIVPVPVDTDPVELDLVICDSATRPSVLSVPVNTKIYEADTGKYMINDLYAGWIPFIPYEKKDSFSGYTKISGLKTGDNRDYWP